MSYFLDLIGRFRGNVSVIVTRWSRMSGVNPLPTEGKCLACGLSEKASRESLLFP